MSLLSNPIVLRMAVMFVAAGFAFVMGLLLIRRMRRSITEEASFPDAPVAPESFPLHTYHAVIQQLKQQKHELLSSQREERRRAKTSENISAAVLSNLSCGVLFFTPNGLVRQANGSAKQILGFASPAGMSAAEMFRDAELISASDGAYANLAEAVDASLREKIRFRHLEARYHTPAGEERTLDITVSAVHAPDNEVLGAACLINDRTEMTEIRRQQELRGEMSAEMALDCALRSPRSRDTRSNSQPAGMRNWHGSWRPTSLPRRRIWIARLVVFSPAQKLQELASKLELTTSMLPAVFQGRKTGRNGATMKRMAYVFLAEIVLTGMLVIAGRRTISASGRLCPRRPQGRQKRSGQEIRQRQFAHNRQNQHRGKGSRVDRAEDANPGSTSDANAAPADSSTAVTPEAQPQDAAKTAEDAKKANDEWKQKFADQKAKIDLLTRELDVAQREYRLRAAAFYADAGNRLRNQGSWDKEDAQYKKDIAQKQKAVDDAKKALDDIKEQGRKAGVSARDRE